MDPIDRRWFDLSLKAGQVFTPTSPIDEPSLFAGRLTEVRQIVDVINQKGQHAVLYGERGVGKTSLANVLSSFLSDHRIGRRVLAPRVNCDSRDDFETVWRKVFTRLADDYRISYEAPRIGFPGGMQAVEHRPEELLGEVVTPDAVRRAILQLTSTTLPILIIDEFDRLNQDTRRGFADTVKMLSDDAVPVTVILVGVADTIDQLIDEHQSVERALVQIRMPRMSLAEIDSVITNGLSELGMSAEPGATARIARLSQGLPHYAHLLGLHAARGAIDSQSLLVSTSNVDFAIDQAIRGSQLSIRSDYEFAVRSPKRDNLFADVLLACALADATELGHFAAQDVRRPLSEITRRRYEIPSFAQHLNEFCEPKRGPILEKSGIKRLYRYRFRNPLMQPFVILQGIQNGRITSENLA
ncbi:MAG TPA: ATP-binding protein [Candidatus Dormibacteraeota bacterium]